jgi:hypothetical protein
MRQEWNKLMQYGVGTATILALTLSAICLYLIVGVAVLICKFLVFIK